MSKSHKKIGILISNLGTPSAPTTRALRKYLREFLSDPSVVRLPRILWLPLLYGVILPIRSGKSAKLYQGIWTEQGSPLLVNSHKQQALLQAEFAQDDILVVLGMRYGEPSIGAAISKLKQKGVELVILLPMYPQFSTSTTESTTIKVTTEMHAQQFSADIKTIHSYASQPLYIKALANSIREHWAKHPRGEKLIFSYHGIPQQQINSGEPYLEHCKATTELVVAELGLQRDAWVMVFQSKFGPAAWLQPYCSSTLKQLADDGIKNVDIICPGFSSDCLETLEEIQVTNKAIFKEAGGESYQYIPALNSRDDHLKLLTTIIKTAINNTQGDNSH